MTATEFLQEYSEQASAESKIERELVQDRAALPGPGAHRRGWADRVKHKIKKGSCSASTTWSYEDHSIITINN